jgi:hypothetical protein
MLKSLHTAYEPSKRSDHWYKLKRCVKLGRAALSPFSKPEVAVARGAGAVVVKAGAWCCRMAEPGIPCHPRLLLSCCATNTAHCLLELAGCLCTSS